MFPWALAVASDADQQGKMENWTKNLCNTGFHLDNDWIW